MPSPKYETDSRHIAQFLIAKNLATREQIGALWPLLAPGKDIGALLVDQGLLPFSIYAKLVDFLKIGAASVPSPGASSPQTPASSIQPQPPQTLPVQPGPPPAPAVSVPENRSVSLSTESSLTEILRYARSIGASDIHFSVNNPVFVRRFGVLLPAGAAPLDAESIERGVGAILTGEQQKRFRETGDLEFVYTHPDSSRYRMTVMKQRAGWDCTARCIPQAIRSFDETGMPPSCKGLTQWAQGLVLITGSASCGKTSTLCTLIQMINQSRRDHVITLEAPIEYVFTSASAQITQREIGKDTVNQETALRAALREDPDIIVVGELRDLSTIRLAVSAAETGHLVFATMNTVSASRTIYRLIDSFPPEEQPIMRNMISESLRGVISQQLIPRSDGTGMVAAFEVLLVNSAVANMIRKDEAHQLGTAMITGKTAGMQLLEDSLKALAAQGLISDEEVALRSFTRNPAGVR